MNRQNYPNKRQGRNFVSLGPLPPGTWTQPDRSSGPLPPGAWTQPNKEEQTLILPAQRMDLRATGTQIVSTDAVASLPSSRESRLLEKPEFSRRRVKKNRVLLFSALCAVILLGVAGYTVWHFLNKGVANVTLYRTSIKSVTQNFGGGGTAYPVQQLNISYPFTSLVLNVFVQPGEKVTPQQPLVQVDFSQVNAQYINQLNAEVAQIYQKMQNDLAYLQSVQGTGNVIIIAQAQQQYNNDQANYNALKAEANATSLHEGKILSTINGIVISVNAYAGQSIGANKIMVTIYDESQSIVRVNMPASNYGQIQINQQAQVNLSNVSNQALTGKVIVVIPNVNTQSGTFQIWVEVDNSSGLLLPGLSAFVNVQATAEALVVPRLSVLNANLAPTVFVVRQQHVYIQSVRIQGEAGDWLIISSGLQANELIVLVGLDTLSNGQMIHITNIES